MKLVPFFLVKKTHRGNEIQHIQLSMFLRFAGKAAWITGESGTITEATLRTDYLEANDIVPKRIVLDKQKQIAWIEVDETKTNLREFYTWDEALANPSKPECWRQFHFFKDRNGADWWSGRSLQAEAEIQDLGNVAEILEEVLRKFT